TFAAMCRPQVTLPWLGERYPAAWGLGLTLFDWDGKPVVGHDGSTPGQSTVWRIVPGCGLVLAIHANGGHVSAFIDEVLAEILSSAAGIRLPPRVLPPDTPVPFRPETYAGRYSAPSVTYEVRADAAGLEITDVPHSLAAQFGEEGTTVRYVHAGGDRFVGVEPDEGLHPLVAFLQDGRFLYNLRAVPRATDQAMSAD
ncbi:serine hydrolase, partial [Streptosporangium algeriense]